MKASSGGRDRTGDSRLMKPKDSSHNPCGDITSDNPPLPLALALAQAELIDADLARLVSAWPTLPPHIKAAVTALVQSAS